MKDTKTPDLFGTPARDPKRVIITIPPGSERGVCKSEKCKAPIFWVLTGSGRSMPVDPDGTPHHATCQDVEAFRRKP